MRAVGLGLCLFLAWLAFSGHYTPFLMGVGAASTLLCVIVAARMGTLDEEGVPLQLLGLGFISYSLWLAWEIVKSALSVTKIILNPRLPISPTMTRVRAGQDTPVGVAVYANSITLTPGTITIAATCAPDGSDCHELVVHALSSAGADDLEVGDMDARVSRFVGGR